MSENSLTTRVQIVRIALLGEGILLLIALPWFLLREHHFLFSPLSEQLLMGAYVTIPLLAINYLLHISVAHVGLFPSLSQFRSEYLYPLSKDLLLRDISLIALLSGFGEELLFRGVLAYEVNSLLGETLGILLVSFVFAYVHLIGMAKEYILLLILYLGVGLYYSYLSWFNGQILTVAISHALFNFLSLLFLRKAANNQHRARHCL